MSVPFRVLRAAYGYLGRDRDDAPVGTIRHEYARCVIRERWKSCLVRAMSEAWPSRTAEDERRDAVAGLRLQARACVTHERIMALNDAAYYLERGHHEGAANR